MYEELEAALVAGSRQELLVYCQLEACTELEVAGSVVAGSRLLLYEELEAALVAGTRQELLVYCLLLDRSY